MADEPELVKIHVTLDPEQGGPAGESLWALPLEDGTFEVRNIPYFTYGIHVHDVVRCELEDRTATDPHSGEALEYSEREVVEVVRPGGWNTLRIIFQRGADHDAMRKVVDVLVEMGGHPDLAFPGFLSLGVPPDAELEGFLEYLDDLAEAEMLQFETAEQKVEGSFSAAPEDVE